MQPTIHDLARKLKLSITTVSRALDGYADVSEKTRARVIQAAKELGYQPNRAARQLRRRHAETIGYILPAHKPQFFNPFFAEFIAGLGDEAAVQDFDLLVSTAPPEGDLEKKLYERWVQSNKVDGVVLNRARLQDWRIHYLLQNNIPFTSLERSLDPVQIPCVEVDSRPGILALVDLLLQRGHRRIAFIGGPPYLKIQADRYAAYREGLQKGGIPFDSSMTAEGDLTLGGGYEAANLLLLQPLPPTAIMCINDLTAIGVLHAAHDRGITVGKDLAVTGFDGIEDARHTQPTLTTLNQPVYDIARQLVAMLIKLIENKPLEHPQIVIQPELLIRESTG